MVSHSVMHTIVWVSDVIDYISKLQFCFIGFPLDLGKNPKLHKSSYFVAADNLLLITVKMKHGS